MTNQKREARLDRARIRALEHISRVAEELELSDSEVAGQMLIALVTWVWTEESAETVLHHLCRASFNVERYNKATDKADT